MPDSAVLVVEVIVAAAAAMVALVVVGIAIRRPRTWLAATGVTLLLISPAFALVQPAGATWDGALNVIGYALVFTTYPNGRWEPPWLAIPLVAYLGLGVGLLIGGTALTAQPWWNVAALSEVLLVAALVHRYRRRLSTDERERVRWGVLGGVITFVGMPILVIATALSGTSIVGLGMWGGLLSGPLIIAFPVGLAVGLIRPRAAPVDVALVHVLRVALCAVPITVASGLLLGAMPDIRGAWISIAVVAIATVPLFHLASRLADRFVFRGRLSPKAAQRTLDDRLGAEHSPEDAPLVIAEVVLQALDAAFAAVHGPGLRDATAGDLHQAANLTYPVVYAGEQIATIEVAARPGESTLTRTDRRILGTLAARAAAPLHGARTVTALVEARSAVVVAHEEERRRLRRDLHDDLAPTLVGLRLTASGLERILRPSDAEAADAARAIVSDIHSAIAQTRALAYGLRPPSLDNGGLSAAIRVAARSTDGLIIDVNGLDRPLDLPAAVEVAALRIVQEAVTNVRRHSQALRCDVQVAVVDGALLLSVDDDGDGMPAGPTPGLGLDSMRDRVTALGGRLDVGRSALGGVRIAASLPVGPP